MKGDFTRWTFRPQQHYHGVLKQQGRVDLDEDWNEQGAITSHRIETESLDVIGPSGAPQDNAGFMIQPAKSGSTLSISTGRAYVDGILCENEQQNLLITAQADLPGFQLPTTAAPYIAYLEVWERHITFLDDSEILEVALGGPDTCTRAKTVWQVKLLQAGAANANITCATDVPDYDKLIAPSSGTLNAQAQPTATTDPCMVPAAAGYRSLENQLYRVEIHNGGTGDAAAGSSTASFKWSRENGSVVAAWIDPPSGQNPGPNTLFVGNTVKDSVLSFSAGDWIELSDDTRELNFQPGTLARLTNVQGQVLTVDPTSLIPSGASLKKSDYPLNPKVRRWDSAGVAPTITGKWLDLENGVQVQFSSGTYFTGDYWMIPARTLTANIDWPLDGSNKPVAQSPRGIRRHFCRLAVVQFDGKAWTVTETCLPTFPPLTDLSDNGIHVTDVRLLSPDQTLANDSDVSMDSAMKLFGINVVLDAAADPVSAQPTTCFVTVDVPYPLKDVLATLIANSFTAAGAGFTLDVPRTFSGSPAFANLANLPVLGYQPLILPGGVTTKAAGAAGATANQISWIPGINDKAALTITNVLRAILEVMPPLQPTSRLLTHLTLKGDFIWSQSDPTVYLDGDVFGIARKDPNATHIGLNLPKSGNGKRGGDFEMWFWLVLPVAPIDITFSPSPVVVSPTAPATATGTIRLVGTQMSAGNSITVSAQGLDGNNKAIPGKVATVPASVAVGPSPQIPITAITMPAGMATYTLQVTATYGDISITRNLTVNKGA